jgi:hypothetical protein
MTKTMVYRNGKVRMVASPSPVRLPVYTNGHGYFKNGYPISRKMWMRETGLDGLQSAVRGPVSTYCCWPVYSRMHSNCRG